MGYYEALKSVYGLVYRVESSLRSVDSEKLLTDKEYILSHQLNPFRALFRANRTVLELILCFPKQSA